MSNWRRDGKGTKGPHFYCRHLFYSMTCEEYDALFESQGRECGICQGSNSRGRPLEIDHDHSLGDWAVRGLVCSRCNTGALRMVDENRWDATEVVVAYYANAWHLTHRPSGLEQAS